MASITRRGDMWRAQVRRTGHPSMSESFPTKQEAQKWAREKEHEVDKGKRTPAGLRTTLGDLIDRYEDEISTRPVGKTKKRVIKKLKREFASVRLDEVRKDTLLNFVAREEHRGVQPQTIMQDVLYLRTALKYGGPLMDAEDAVALATVKIDAAYHFLMHARRLANPESRERRPTQDELERIYDWFVARPKMRCPMGDIMLLAVACGLRRGEIVGSGGIRVEDLDVQARELLLRERKHPDGTVGNDEVIPLVAGPLVWRGATIDPVKLIKKQPSYGSGRGRVFPYSESIVSQQWGNACRALQIPNLHFHDLRHESVSRMFEFGMNIPQVALVSGHKDWKNLKRYTNLKPSHVHNSLVSSKYTRSSV